MTSCLQLSFRLSQQAQSMTGERDRNSKTKSIVILAISDQIALSNLFAHCN